MKSIKALTLRVRHSSVNSAEKLTTMVYSTATKTARKRAANAQYRAKKKREKVVTLLTSEYIHSSDHRCRAKYWDKESYAAFISMWLSWVNSTYHIRECGKQSLSKNT